MSRPLTAIRLVGHLLYEDTGGGTLILSRQVNSPSAGERIGLQVSLSFPAGLGGGTQGTWVFTMILVSASTTN